MNKLLSIHFSMKFRVCQKSVEYISKKRKNEREEILDMMLDGVLVPDKNYILDPWAMKLEAVPFREKQVSKDHIIIL